MDQSGSSLKDAEKEMKAAASSFGDILKGVNNRLRSPEFTKYKDSLNDEDAAKLKKQLETTAKDLALSMEALVDINKY